MEGISLIERYFRLAENQTTIRRELVGGLTTFLTMAYIVVVNPQILSQAGMPAEGVVFATCISAAAATLVMGLYANYPIALTPGMSLNAYFTYSVCLGMHVPWRSALGVIFISGMFFLILTVTRIREQIVNGIPGCLKHSTAAGIGMFIAFVGLRNAKLVVANSATFVGLGNLSDHEVQAACFGLALAVVLMVRKVNGAILISIFATTLLGILRGMAKWPAAIVSLPHPSYTWLQLDLRGAMQLGLLEIIFVFLFVDLFDNVGTLVGVCEQGGFVRDGKIPRVGRALVSDAVGTIFGALTGTSTVTSYIESAAGVAAGARTGLSNMVVAGLFVASAFCSPLAIAIPGYATDPRGCFDDGIDRPPRLEGFHGRLARFRDDPGHAADFQHRHRPEPGADLLHSGEGCSREIPGGESSAGDTYSTIPSAHEIEPFTSAAERLGN
jgi:AGZA family xanthine/uracil permease-like MFS transporter